MPKRNHEEIVFDDGEDEDSEEDPIAIGDEEDDDEGNKDLSLKILEKVLSRSDFNDSKETRMSDLSGSGVVSTVIVNGGNSKSSKKMKGTNPEMPTKLSSIGSKVQSKDKMVEDLTKGKDDEVKVERSAEPKAGEISSNMVLKKLLMTWSEVLCPPDAGQNCYSCGEQDHGHDCYIGKNGGHGAKDCPDNCKSWSKTAICLRCGDSGHDMILCKYESSHDYLKDIHCYVCKRFGNLCCVEPGNSPLSDVAGGRYYEESTKKDSASSCFRCGEEGHFSCECSNSSSISTSHGKDSPSLCYRCNGAGHKKKNKETSEHYSTPRESNGKMKKKKTHKGEHGEHPQTTLQKPKLRSGNIRRPKSPITPSGHNHHRLPTTYMGHFHNHRSPTFSSSGHYPGSQSTTSYGRNHRNSSYESSGHLSDHPHSMWQPHYPSPSHHHHQIHRYAPAPSSYGPVHHYSEFPENYGRW
ncbi:hypothetical protein EUTSA_v10002930mg [Eutrema salsugineum]|uniref:CCHC-type domain-containing protein n=1 Tax=Eutrema salsugineum TaxID=72664 RepID=V4L1S1_EUTSA|nr:hypothetical protein EUTSA_v10002930mg [Eutrema salsugineum]